MESNKNLCKSQKYNNYKLHWKRKFNKNLTLAKKKFRKPSKNIAKMNN